MDAHHSLLITIHLVKIMVGLTAVIDILETLGIFKQMQKESLHLALRTVKYLLLDLTQSLVGLVLFTCTLMILEMVAPKTLLKQEVLVQESDVEL